MILLLVLGLARTLRFSVAVSCAVAAWAGSGTTSKATVIITARAALRIAINRPRTSISQDQVTQVTFVTKITNCAGL